jgi:hypothetical protein
MKPNQSIYQPPATSSQQPASSIQLLSQDLIDQFWIGFTAGCLHDLADEKSQ